MISSLIVSITIIGYWRRKLGTLWTVDWKENRILVQSFWHVTCWKLPGTCFRSVVTLIGAFLKIEIFAPTLKILARPIATLIFHVLWLWFLGLPFSCVNKFKKSENCTNSVFETPACNNCKCKDNCFLIF